ncbi:MAG: OsmC domain/YcaO domain-containing protein [Deltaproteobacteria bacterium]|nr:OsmC domain/YcaO domain-containing protein [Deltaproteobacteria bacterium]
MQVRVRFLENLRLEAEFDEFKVVSDQPIRYKGDGSAPGPFDYFLASSALCAAYFVKVYCNARDIPTEDIQITQDNIVDPNNRYQQTFVIRAQLPDQISAKDRKGIIAAMERCTVKRVIQNNPDFTVEVQSLSQQDTALAYSIDSKNKTMIVGKDLSLEETITNMTQILTDLGIKIEIASWRNIVPHVWSVHIRDADAPMCFSNGKGATQDAALCSALGEFLERLSTHYFYSDYYLGEQKAKAAFVHDPQEKWFPIPEDQSIPPDLMDAHLKELYANDGELEASHLVDTNTGDPSRGICALPYVRQSDQKTIWIPVNLITNLYASNGMSAGNTQTEARVQALSEIFERAVKNQIIAQEITLPDIPQAVLTQYPTIIEGIATLEAHGYPILVKDASLGGKFPVVCVILMNPKNGGVYASFGAHPKFAVALERTLTELMQGRSFEGLLDIQAPTFNSQAVRDHSNLVDHFIDSTGIVSWKLFAQTPDYTYTAWNMPGSTQEEYAYLMDILHSLNKEVYIAEYTSLGAQACRILVPDYSEVYEAQDLVWDNFNRAIVFRSNILSIHTLDQQSLEQLLDDFAAYHLDDHLLISELIGIAFDETDPWSRATVLELKILIFLALQNYDQAKDHIDLFLSYNENTVARCQLYQLLQIVLDIQLREDLHIDEYKTNLCRMYGENLFASVINCIRGKEKFIGLQATDMQLKGIAKHSKLLASYQKIQTAKQVL